MPDQATFVDAPRQKLRHIGRNILNRGYEARIACDSSSKRDAYELRYRSYYSQGHIETRTDGLLFDRFDELPTTKTMVVYVEGKAVGSIRTCLLRRGEGTMSPCREAYPMEVEALLNGTGPERAGYDGIEVNRMVRAPEASDDQGLVFMLYRLAGYMALAADFRVIVTCVRQHHLPFYKRLRFEQAGEAKVYPGLTCPMLLLQIGRTNYDTMRESFRLMDPEAGQTGILSDLELGKTVTPHLVHRT